MTIEKNKNNVLELLVNEGCRLDEFYSFSDYLSSRLSIQYDKKIDGFDTIYWHFNYQGNDLTLSYNIYLGISIYHRKGKEALSSENAILYSIKNILESQQSK